MKLNKTLSGLHYKNYEKFSVQKKWHHHDLQKPRSTYSKVVVHLKKRTSRWPIHIAYNTTLNIGVVGDFVFPKSIGNSDPGQIELERLSALAANRILIHAVDKRSEVFFHNTHSLRRHLNGIKKNKKEDNGSH